MSQNRRTLLVRLLAAVFMISGIAWATPITFTTPSGSATSDGSVNATAVFVVSPGVLTITLNDLLSNPTSVGQLSSNLAFSLSSSLSASASMSSSAQERTVNGDHSFTEGGAPVSTGWALQAFGSSGLILCVICPNNGTPAPTTNPPPSHLIIGAGAYTNANGSIAGNGPHNPFLDETATFTIHDSTITSTMVVSHVVFGFGTQFGSTVNGELSASGSAVPESRTMLMIGTGLVLLGIFKKRLAKT
jgi:hypothetical protein